MGFFWVQVYGRGWGQQGQIVSTNRLKVYSGSSAAEAERPSAALERN